MPGKLSPEELMTLATLSSKSQPNAQIACTIGVTEGAVRDHLRRAATGVTDGRRGKPHQAARGGPGSAPEGAAVTKSCPAS